MRFSHIIMPSILHVPAPHSVTPKCTFRLLPDYCQATTEYQVGELCIAVVPKGGQ
jgi:hypothetical protein